MTNKQNVLWNKRGLANRAARSQLETHTTRMQQTKQRRARESRAESGGAAAHGSMEYLAMGTWSSMKVQGVYVIPV
jgi:hypothetical protein